VEHTEPPLDAPEEETLSAFLDYYRALILDKAGGLSHAQLHQTLGPSTLTLGSLVHHLALAEHYWFYETFAGGNPIEPWAGRTEDEDWELTIAPDLDTNVIFGRYTEACDRSRAIVERAGSLEELGARESWDRECSLRWILIHMIEETARHAGHADLIRESIDGEAGDFRDR
jgi:uncharacterized damage-inducible protein DinB